MTREFLLYAFLVSEVLYFIPHIKKFGFRRIWPSEFIDKFFYFRNKYRASKDKKYLVLFIWDIVTSTVAFITTVCIIFELY